MQFAPPPRRNQSENLLPMINVVFLLLIFFLLAARLAPRAPVFLTPPEVAAAPQEPAPPLVRAQALVLWLSASGDAATLGPAGEAIHGEAALQALALARQTCPASAPATPAATATSPEPCGRLILHLDAATPAAALSALLPRLSGLGFTRLAVMARPAAPPPEG